MVWRGTRERKGLTVDGERGFFVLLEGKARLLLCFGNFETRKNPKDFAPL